MEEVKVDNDEKNIKLLYSLKEEILTLKEEVKDLKKYFEYVIQNMEEDDDFIDDDEAIEADDEDDDHKEVIPNFSYSKKYSDKGNNSYNNNYKKNTGSNYSNRTFKKAKKTSGFSNSNKNGYQKRLDNH